MANEEFERFVMDAVDWKLKNPDGCLWVNHQQADKGTSQSQRQIAGGPHEEQPTSYRDRESQSPKEKETLGRYTASFLEAQYPGGCIGIDGGTTNASILTHFNTNPERPRVGMIVTNHLHLPPSYMVNPDSVSVHLTGGVLRPGRNASHGETAVKSITKFEFATSVIGVNGFKFPKVFTVTGRENEVKMAYLKQSQDVTFCFDSSKWSFAAGMKLTSIKKLVGSGKNVSVITSIPDLSDESRTNYGRDLKSYERLSDGINRLLGHSSSDCRCSMRIARIHRKGDRFDYRDLNVCEMIESGITSIDLNNEFEQKLPGGGNGGKVIHIWFSKDSPEAERAATSDQSETPAIL